MNPPVAAGNTDSPVATKHRTPSNSLDSRAPEANLNPRDELAYLVLQAQRTLVLDAMRFCRTIDRIFFGKTDPPISLRLLDLTKEDEIQTAVQAARAMTNRWPVSLARALHMRLDDSRKLKEWSITAMLWFRAIVWRVQPKRRYGPYNAWVKILDTPSVEQQQQWFNEVREWNHVHPLHIVLVDRALKDPAKTLRTLKRYSNYKIQVYAVGHKEELHSAQELSDQLDLKLQTFEALEWRLGIARFLEHPSLAQAKNLMFISEPGEISARCLYEASLAEMNQNHTHFKLAYSDSDHVSETGHRGFPRFHANWNLRYFVGQNCLRGWFMIEREHFKDILLSAEGPQAPQNWQEVLALVGLRVIDESVLHIQKILFHSSDINLVAEADFFNATKKYIEHDFQGARVIKGLHGGPAVSWPLPEKLPKVSILIPTRDRVDLVKQIVNDILFKTIYENLEIIIINNGSREKKTKDYFADVQKNSRVRVVDYDFPFNYSAINNHGFKYATGEILALLNNDMEVISSRWLTEMVREALQPDVGIVGAKLYFKSGFIQHAGVVLGSGQVPGHIHGLEHRISRGYCDRLLFSQRISAVTGACMVMRREIYEKVGGLNEVDLAVAYNDIDLCLRVGELGYKIIWTPFAELYHFESASRPPDRRPEQLVRYRKEVEFMRNRWRAVVENDPYYNPNFTREKCTYQVPDPMSLE